jgi:hypothetical protein
MSRDTSSVNRFDALASEQSPEKRMNTRTTPEAFKPQEESLANLSSIGAPDVEILAPPIERINRSRAPGSSAGARDKKGRDTASKNIAQKPVVNAWVKPPVISGLDAAAADRLSKKKKQEAANPGPSVKLIKVEKPERSKADNDFLKELRLELPDLLASIDADAAADSSEWFTCELSCKPNPDWGTSDQGPNLDDYAEEKKMLQVLSLTAGPIVGHSVKLEPMKAISVEGLRKKKFFYQLSCTSEEALNAIVKHPSSQEYRGWSLAFYQPKDSRYGYRFQFPIKGLPAPFQNYEVADWLQVAISQGFDAQSITHIAIGVIAVPGEMRRRTGMLDIYIKPEACESHGCDGALDNAGTAQEVLGKRVEYPPSQILLGRNPSEEAQDLIAEGLCVGQYYTATTDARPMQGPNNSMLEIQVGAAMRGVDYGKTWVRKISKVGSCRWCWGPPHNRDEVCMYSGKCKECLATLAGLPSEGFHHACRSLVVSMAKPSDKKQGASFKRKSELYDTGTPANAAMAVYNPSVVKLAKRQKLLESLKAKQLQRVAEAAAEAAAEKAATDELEAEEYEAYLLAVQLDPEPVLSEEARAAQASALDLLGEEVHMDTDFDL